MLKQFASHCKCLVRIGDHSLGVGELVLDLAKLGINIRHNGLFEFLLGIVKLSLDLAKLGVNSAQNETIVADDAISGFVKLSLNLAELGINGRYNFAVIAGERQRVAVARALAGEPKLMLFDEPTGNLDVGSEAKVLREVKSLAEERGITVLASLHDLNSALSLGDRFLTLKEGRITQTVTSEGLTAEILSETFDTNIKILSAEGRRFIVGDVFYEI